MLIVCRAVAARRPGTAPRAQPVICEISWSPGEQGAAFLATAQRRPERNGSWPIAALRRAAAGAPDDDAASHAAYDQLLNDLYADGWLPYERGREWWEMRLRRTTAPKHREARMAERRLTRGSLVRGGVALAAGGAALAVWPRTTESAPSPSRTPRSCASP